MTNRNRRKMLGVECLETRRVLDAAALHNFLEPLDVNDDQQVTAIDALAIINHLNRTATGELAAEAKSLFLDVTDSSSVEPNDALRVINALSRRETDQVDRVFSQLSVDGGARMRAEFLTDRPDRATSRFVVRLQDARPGQSYPVLVNGGLVGSITADSDGRGVLEITENSNTIDGDRSESEENANLLSRLRSLLPSECLVHLDGIGAVALGESNQDSDDSTRRIVDPNVPVEIPNLRMLPNPREITGQVFAAAMRRDDAVLGGAYIAEIENGESIGLFVRGLSAGGQYEVDVDGVQIATLTAGRLGVISWLFKSSEPNAEPLANPLPEITEDSIITVSSEGIAVTGTFRILELPFGRRPNNGQGELPQRLADTLVAPLNSEGVRGLVTFTPIENGYRLGVAVRGASRRESYDVLVDGQTVATVDSNMFGAVLFRTTQRTSPNQDALSIQEGSIVEIRGLARGRFEKLGDRVRDFFNLL